MIALALLTALIGFPSYANTLDVCSQVDPPSLFVFCDDYDAELNQLTCRMHGPPPKDRLVEFDCTGDGGDIGPHKAYEMNRGADK